MPKQVWICEKCGSEWVNEEAAKNCEAVHRMPLEYKPMSWVKYDQNTSFCSNNRMFPQRILVRIPMESAMGGYDTATYMLERVGPKGL